MDLEWAETDDNLTDFSNSKQAPVLNSRLCECGAVHLTLHDEDDKMFAHADMRDPEAVRNFGNIFLHYAAMMEEMINQGGVKNELQIPRN